MVVHCVLCVALCVALCGTVCCVWHGLLAGKVSKDFPATHKPTRAGNNNSNNNRQKMSKLEVLQNHSAYKT